MKRRSNIDGIDQEPSRRLVGSLDTEESEDSRTNEAHCDLTRAREDFDGDDELPWDEEVVAHRLACDHQFARRYYALVELARTAAPGKDLAEIARSIIADDRMLGRRVAASDREARRFQVKDRFRKNMQFGILRRLDGPFSPLPEVLPEQRSANDRIFAHWETLSWELVVGEQNHLGWTPVRRWLTKRIISATVGLRESSIDAYMKKGDLQRIPLVIAPVKDEACFWTDEVMSWPRMQDAMRGYRHPLAVVRVPRRRRG